MATARLATLPSAMIDQLRRISNRGVPEDGVIL
jgi:hypothetical protein